MTPNPAPPKLPERYKAVITLWDQVVAPRFDQCAESLVADIDGGRVDKTRTVIMAHPSAEELCRLILGEGARVLVTGGIQRRYYEYLQWKKVEVIDSVMGPWEAALERLAQGRLAAEDILYPRGDG